MKKSLKTLGIAVALLTIVALSVGWNCSNQVPVQDETLPGTVAGLSIAAPSSDNAQTFTWGVSINGNTEVESYVVSVDGREWLNIGDATSYVLISALSPGAHTFKVRAVDEGGNVVASGDLVFSSSETADATPPTISGVSASDACSLTAIVTWTTDEPATSQVEYGVTANYGFSSGTDTILKTSHSVTLANLTSATTYHYRVLSADSRGNQSVCCDYVFVTPHPTFELEILMVSPAEAMPGQQVSVSTRVRNVGSADGVYTAELVTNDRVVETRDVALRSGSSAVVTFTVSRTEPGAYNVAIGDRSGSFTVSAPACSIIVALKDEETGKPIGKIYGIGYPSVAIDGEDRGYVTDYGQFAVQGLTSGTHLLKVVVPTYGEVSRYVELDPGEQKEMAVEINMPNPVYDVAVKSVTWTTGNWLVGYREWGRIEVTLTNMGAVDAVSPSVNVLVFTKSKDATATISDRPIQTTTLDFHTLAPKMHAGSSETLVWDWVPYVYGPLEVVVVAVHDNWEWTPSGGPWEIHGVAASPTMLQRLTESVVTWLEGNIDDVLGVCPSNRARRA